MIPPAPPLSETAVSSPVSRLSRHEQRVENSHRAATLDSLQRTDQLPFEPRLRPKRICQNLP